MCIIKTSTSISYLQRMAGPVIYPRAAELLFKPYASEDVYACMQLFIFLRASFSFKFVPQFFITGFSSL